MILSTGARWLLRLAAAAVLTFIYAPLALVLLNSFSTSVTFAWPPPGYTLRWWQAAASNEGVRTALVTSVEVALAAALIAVVLGTLASMALVRYEFFGRDAVSLLVLLPIALPGIVTGIALNTLFTQALGGLTFFTLVVGHATFCIVIVVNNASARLRRMSSTAEEASLDLGANYWQTFWRVTLPNLRLPIIGAALLIFTLSMDEIAVSFFLIGRDNTLPLEIWSRLRRGMTPEINAISTVIFVFSLIAIVLWYRLRARSEGQPELGAELVEAAASGH